MQITVSSAKQDKDGKPIDNEGGRARIQLVIRTQFQGLDQHGQPLMGWEASGERIIANEGAVIELAKGQRLIIEGT